MKVVIPVGDLHIGGGCQVLVDIANALQAAGHDTEVVMPASGTVQYDLQAKLSVVPVLTREHIPEGDLILTNFFTTCIGPYEAYKDRCVRLSLGFEPYWVPDKQTALWTYKQGVPVIAISHWLDEQIAAHTHQRSQVVPLGVDVNVFHPGPRQHVTGSPKVIMYIARNPAYGYELKGFTDFQAAIARLRDTYNGDFIVHMVCPEGDLSLPDGVPYRVFRPTSAQEMADLYRGADLFVSTSWFEAFALPPLEAMACGTPVVSTNSGGLLDYCTDMENAVLTPPRDPDALAAQMAHVLQDAQLAKTLSQAGVATASRFTKEKYLREMIAAIENAHRDRAHYVEPKVSIVIPFYNCAYIAQAIESALAQTYSNLEVIVVDDGSTEHVEKVHPYFDKIHYLRKENGGTASALNAGIHHATGRYFSWLSADDEFLPDKTAKQVQWMQENQLTISYGAFFYMNERGELISGKVGTAFASDVDFYRTMSQWCPVNGCTVMIDMRVFETVGVFDETLLYTHDYDLWLRALQHYPFRYLDVPLVRYRVHGEMGTKKHERAIAKELLVVQQKYKSVMKRMVEGGLQP
ncbi:glycosyltransferase [Alicyclobacillus acidoterrestris]|uniref:glycosyltransferase n=1 Tax=Alicyclobacillus acidoterrestris TaxID=1450 RepID=UPI003F52EB44